MVTSKRFLARMPLELEGVTLVHLEDALAGISRWQKARSLLAGCCCRAGSSNMSCSASAGTAPRRRGDGHLLQRQHRGAEGVPLTYRNVSSNTAAGVDHITLVKGDRLLAPCRSSTALDTRRPLAAAADRARRPSFTDPPPRRWANCASAPLHRPVEHGHVPALLPAAVPAGRLPDVAIMVCGAGSCRRRCQGSSRRSSVSCRWRATARRSCRRRWPSTCRRDVRGIKQIRNKIGTVGHLIPVWPPAWSTGHERALDARLRRDGSGGPNLMPGYTGSAESARRDPTAGTRRGTWARSTTTGS